MLYQGDHRLIQIIHDLAFIFPPLFVGLIVMVFWALVVHIIAPIMTAYYNRYDAKTELLSSIALGLTGGIHILFVSLFCVWVFSVSMWGVRWEVYPVQTFQGMVGSFWVFFGFAAGAWLTKWESES